MLQTTSALSTIEAKYMAFTKASKNAVWLKRVSERVMLEAWEYFATGVIVKV